MDAGVSKCPPAVSRLEVWRGSFVAWLGVVGCQRGMLVGTPLVKTEQDCSIRTDDLPEVVVGRSRLHPQCKPRFDLCGILTVRDQNRGLLCSLIRLAKFSGFNGKCGGGSVKRGPAMDTRRSGRRFTLQGSADRGTL